MRILIVEDDVASAIYLRKVLSAYGKCDVATNGVKAIEEYIKAYKEESPYELVCLDIMIPRMDGIQVLDSINEFISHSEGNDNKPKIIMISALNDKETVDYVTQGGCDAFLWKPVSIGMIEGVMTKIGFTKNIQS